MPRKSKAKLPKELKNHLENFRQNSGKPTSKRKTTVNFKKNY